MDYMIVANEAAARQRSGQIAQSLACGPITLYWFGWRLHPTDGRAALLIPEIAEDKIIAERGRPKLTGTELANLKRPLSADWEPEP